MRVTIRSHWVGLLNVASEVEQVGRQIEAIPGRYLLSPTAGQRSIVQNLGARARRRYWLGLPVEGPWRVAIDTDDRRYGGEGAGWRQPIAAVAVPFGGMPASAVISLPAFGTLFLRPATD